MKTIPLEVNYTKSQIRSIAWHHKLSTFNTILISSAALLIPSSVAFLGFVWSNPNGGNVNGAFRRLVVDGWTVQAVTITSVVLRFAISISAG